VTTDTASKQGFYPVSQQVADFQYGELRGYSANSVNYSRLGTTGIDFFPSAALFRRKVYGWISCEFSSNGICACSLQFLFNKSIVGKLPLATANIPTLSLNSWPSLFTTSTQSVQDALLLSVSNPVYNQGSTVILQPCYLYGKFDEVIVNVDTIQNVTDIRIWVGVVSSL
jgi:hypothetical protein